MKVKNFRKNILKVLLETLGYRLYLKSHYGVNSKGSLVSSLLYNLKTLAESLLPASW
jgi:hypothetical protein